MAKQNSQIVKENMTKIRGQTDSQAGIKQVQSAKNDEPVICPINYEKSVNNQLKELINC